VREQFAVWYPRTAEEREQFVTNGLITVDTNVLLHLYRMTDKGRSEMLDLLSSLGDRLWIPHQVGLEFHRNRFNVIREQEQAEQNLRKAVDEAAERLNQAISGLRDHPVINRSALREASNDGFSRIRSYLNAAGIGSYLSLETALRADDVLDSITSLFKGKVGEPYTADQMSSIEAAGRARFDKQIPPGYADTKKNPDRQLGDYILWRQVLDEAARRKLPVLFITNDQKEDWYRRIHGLTVGPRFELMAEMLAEAGVPFHAQTLALFIETAPPLLRSPLQDSTVAEVIRMDEFDRSSFRADQAADLAERDLDRQAPKPKYDQSATARVQPDARDVQIVRLEARRSELTQRIADLNSELEAEQRREALRAGTETNDPRSYVSAIRARLDASSRVLIDTTQQLYALENY
jgi:hypothetical protein